MPIHLPPLNRRQFLTGTLAAGAAALAPALSFAGKNKNTETVLFLSDTHVGSHENDERHGVKPAPNLAQAVHDALALKNRPSRAIVTGDCAFLHGEPGNYKMFGRLIEPLRRAGMDIHLLVGNHDSRERLEDAFPDAKKSAVIAAQKFDKYVSVLETPAANWFFLDSLRKTSDSPGSFGKEQIQWLADALDARKNKPAILFAHHNPSLFNPHGLVDTAAFFDVIVPRKQVKAYIYGHTHAWHVTRQQGMHLINIPTTAWLFGEQPRGFVVGDLRRDSLALTLHSLDAKHPKHLEKVELVWR